MASSTGVIRVGDKQSDEILSEEGVRQGCLLSPMLFNKAGEKIMRLAEEEMSERCGCVLGEKNVCSLRYADDITLIATIKEELRKPVSSIKRHSERQILV